MLRRLRAGRQAFRDTFEPREGELAKPASARKALAHIRHFCGGEVQQSPYNSDALAMARMVGRLEVYKEIMRFLSLTDAQIDVAARRAAQAEGGEDV